MRQRAQNYDGAAAHGCDRERLSRPLTAYTLCMESLALMVFVLLAIIILSGPIAIGLTSKRVKGLCAKRVVLSIFRRTFVTLTASIGLLLSINLIFINLPLWTKLLGLLVITCNLYGFKREYFQDQKLRSLFSNPRGSDGRDGHGPAGQH